MGKSSKAHRAKVEKRNQKITVEKYAMKKAIEKMFEAQKMMSETENLNVELNGIGNVYYYGLPSVINKVQYGKGKLIKAQ